MGVTKRNDADAIAETATAGGPRARNALTRAAWCSGCAGRLTVQRLAVQRTVGVHGMTAIAPARKSQAGHTASSVASAVEPACQPCDAVWGWRLAVCRAFWSWRWLWRQVVCRQGRGVVAVAVGLVSAARAAERSCGRTVQQPP